MNQIGNNQQYLIIAKDKISIQYEIIMSINILKDTLNLIIEPNENFYQKYKAELNLESIRNIHNSLQVNRIQDAYKEIINLVEYNKKFGIENKINLEQNMFLMIPYAHNCIKFELQKKDLNYGDKFNYLEKIIKNLQNQINTMNERIKKLENNVKEYNSYGKLVFDGEYKDGKRYIGKEYDDNGKLIFDGEYKDGKRYIGKEYNDNGKLIFDGEYKNNKRYIGKEYNDNGKLIFDGEYKVETGLKLNGQIKKYDGKKNILYFEGEIKDGKLWNGTFYKLNGAFYGKIINGKGKGKEFQYIPYNDFWDEYYKIFEVEFKDGKYYRGKIIIDGNYQYVEFEGEFKDGNYFRGKKYKDNHGNGPQILEFEGEFKDGNYYIGKQYIYEKSYLAWEITHNEGSVCSAKNYDKNGRLLFEGTIVTLFDKYKKEKNYLDGKISIYDINDDLEFEGQIIKGERKKGIQYFKANSQMFINETKNAQKSNTNEINENQVNPEDKIKFEGEIKGALWWTGKFYLINNSGNKTFLGELNEGNGRIKKFWDFEEFEGEVRNGNFWKGSYKKYNIKGKIIFDGEWRDGHKYKGKEYNDEGKLVFEGEYKNGKKYKGKEYDSHYENKLIFDGEYKDGKQWNGEIKIVD